jgi:hypothetical protein
LKQFDLVIVVDSPSFPSAHLVYQFHRLSFAESKVETLHVVACSNLNACMFAEERAAPLLSIGRRRSIC